MLRSVSIVRTLSALLFSLVLVSTAFAQVTTEAPKSEKPKADSKSANLQKADVPAPKLAGDGKPQFGFVSRHEKFNERVKQGNVDLLFIGDSITQGWEANAKGGKGSVLPRGGKEVWEKFYTKRNAVNLGIGGDQTQHVLWRLQNGNLEGGIKPKAAVVMIGTNNASGSYTAEEIASGVTEIVKTIHTKLPETKILLLGVFPRGADPNDAKIKLLREKITNVNEIIKKLDDGKSVYYMDICSKFIESDGSISDQVMYDALHFTDKGYGIWAEAIEEKLAKLMGEK